MKFGARMSTSGGVWKALERGFGIQCEIVQIFVKNNMRWFGKPYAPNDVGQYANALVACQFSCVFGHTGYLINLAAPPSANRDNSIKSLIQEINFATGLGLPFLVLHPGAHLSAGEDMGGGHIKGSVNSIDNICIRSLVVTKFFDAVVFPELAS